MLNKWTISYSYLLLSKWQWLLSTKGDPGVRRRDLPNSQSKLEMKPIAERHCSLLLVVCSFLQYVLVYFLQHVIPPSIHKPGDLAWKTHGVNAMGQPLCRARAPQWPGAHSPQVLFHFSLGTRSKERASPGYASCLCRVRPGFDFLTTIVSYPLVGSLFRHIL